MRNFLTVYQLRDTVADTKLHSKIERGAQAVTNGGALKYAE